MTIIKEFKEFAIKGNVIDLAVGVIIGGAFGKIVDSVVADLPDDVIVIDYGRKIAEGKFAEVRLLPRVQQAYLGQKAVEDA